MLFIKSNFNGFKGRQGKAYTEEELTKLSKCLVTTDVVNFRGDMSRGFPAGITIKIIDKIDPVLITPDSKILILNDITMHMINTLTDYGYKQENIYLAYGKWEKDGKTVKPSSDTTTYNIMNQVIKYNFTGTFNIIKLEEIFTTDMTFDLIIANPPYGAIGANITKALIDTIEFKEYVNLLPANDYKRNTTKDLFNYQSDMEAIQDGFADAAVTTHVAKLHAEKVNSMTLDEFERSQYIDPQLDKYFVENAKRSSKALENAYMPLRFTEESAKLSPNTSIIIGIRDVNHKHMPYEKTSNTYKWNVLKTISVDNIVVLHPEKKTANEFMHQFIVFDTDVEKDNFSSFMYSRDGFRFLAKVFTAINIDGATKAWKVFPKVDWTRAWTVEEILEEYGYTPEEIQAVMEDLKNYKGMED